MDDMGMSGRLAVPIRHAPSPGGGGRGRGGPRAAEGGEGGDVGRHGGVVLLRREGPVRRPTLPLQAARGQGPSPCAFTGRKGEGVLGGWPAHTTAHE